MKRVKYLFWLLVAVLAAIVVYQNKQFFIVERSFQINLYFFSYRSPELPTGVYYLSVFLVGMLISYLVGLPGKFRARRTIRQLNDRIAADKKRIAELESGAAAGAEKEKAAAPEGRSDAQPHERSHETVTQ